VVILLGCLASADAPEGVSARCRRASSGRRLSGSAGSVVLAEPVDYENDPALVPHLL
jgi:hypothetical protein